MALGVAVNLAMAGIQQMMAPDPSVDDQQEESYIYQGAAQNIKEGDPVPNYMETRVPGRTVGFHTRNSGHTFTSYSGATSDAGEQQTSRGLGQTDYSSVNGSSSVYNQQSIRTILPKIIE